MMRDPRRHGGLFLTLLVLALAPANGPEARGTELLAHPIDAADNPVLLWDEAVLQGIRATSPGPTVAARSLAVTHTAMLDAWSAYDAIAVPTRPHVAWRRPQAERTQANKAEAVSVAAHRAVTDLFPGQSAAYDALLRSLGHEPGAPAEPGSPSAVGRAAADAVLEFRHRDGSNQLGDLHAGPYSDYTGYVPVNTPTQLVDPNRWQPLPVIVGGRLVFQTYTTPHWGLVTPFALKTGSEHRPVPGPALYPDAAYRGEADEILAASANLTDEQKVIAEHFADGPSSEFPPGHWALFAQFVSRRDGHGLDEDVRMFFALGNALLDASIAAWDAKRAYDSVRPITAIRFLYAGQMVRAWGGPFQGTRMIPGETWSPYQLAGVVTPPFPEFVSGHSTYSAASAEVLARFTGSDAFGASVVIRAGSSPAEPGLVPATDLTLSWPTFSDAAEQAGLSRRYGGIHFSRGDLSGRALGRIVGAQAWSLAQAYVEGRAGRAPLDGISRARPPARLIVR